MIWRSNMWHEMVSCHSIYDCIFGRNLFCWTCQRHFSSVIAPRNAECRRNRQQKLEDVSCWRFYCCFPLNIVWEFCTTWVVLFSDFIYSESTMPRPSDPNNISFGQPSLKPKVLRCFEACKSEPAQLTHLLGILLSLSRVRVRIV